MYGGTNDVDNCVIICTACHYVAHGGRFNDKKLYSDLSKLTMKERIAKVVEEYKFYDEAKNGRLRRKKKGL